MKVKRFTALALDLPHDEESTRGLPTVDSDGARYRKEMGSALHRASVNYFQSMTDMIAPLVNVRIVQPDIKAVLRLGVGAAKESVALTEHAHLGSHMCRGCGDVVSAMR